MTYVGIDACSKGWIAVVMAANGIAQAHFLPTIALVESVIPDAGVIAIDIPIGFPTTGHREADLSARAVLGARRSSLFLTPSLPVLEAETHAVATALAVKLTEQGISRQSYGLRTKIFEVAQWVSSAPCPVHEAHPEVSFTRLIGAPAKQSKKTWAGMVERREALDRAGIMLDDITPDAARYAAVDDMFDAAVLAWTARRIHEGTAESFPAMPEVSTDGRVVAIWA